MFLVVGLAVQVYQKKFVLISDVSMIAEVLISSAIFVGLLGLAIRIFTVGYTPDNTSGRNTKDGQVADELNTTGIYSIMRNPLYLGNYLMWVAVSMLTGNIWFVLLFTLVFWIYYERIVYAEENFLRNKFGQTYIDWTNKTPVFLPKHLNYRKPKMSFSWKKVLKKEKNGLFALFLLFWIFDVVGQYAQNETVVFEKNWISIGALSTGIIYFILKYIKKYTGILNEEGR